METIKQVIDSYPGKITASQIASLDYYLDDHPRMEVRSVWYDSICDILMVGFANGLIMGIETDGSRNT